MNRDGKSVPGSLKAFLDTCDEKSRSKPENSDSVRVTFREKLSSSSRVSCVLLQNIRSRDVRQHHPLCKGLSVVEDQPAIRRKCKSFIGAQAISIKNIFYDRRRSFVSFQEIQPICKSVIFKYGTSD